MAGWRTSGPSIILTVSIPSQAGILLAVHRCGYRAMRMPDVSIPSQAGILLAAQDGLFLDAGIKPSQYPLRRASSWRVRLPLVLWEVVVVSIPSQAGILLAADPARQRTRRVPGLNTLSGGHPLGGVWLSKATTITTCLNTLSGGHPLGGQNMQRCVSVPRVSIPSQAGILLAAAVLARTKSRHRRLNTLSGGHPLGGAGRT